MTQTFSGWNEYDNWLVQNYANYAVTSLNEEQGKIVAEIIEKAEWEKMQKDESSGSKSDQKS